MRRIIIGVMGPGSSATEEDKHNAFELGRLIAQNKWVLLSGGRNSGVMEAVSEGAKSAGGLTMGIMFDLNESKISKYVDIPIMTGMGSARNNINVLTSDVVIACGTVAPGTLSEIALAIKAGRNVVILNNDVDSQKFLKKIGKDSVHIAKSPEETIKIASRLIPSR